MRRRRRDRQLARQKEVAGIALGDFLELAALAELLDVRGQDDFQAPYSWLGPRSA